MRVATRALLALSLGLLLLLPGRADARAAPDQAEYERKRSSLVQQERLGSLGGTLQLSDAEEAANAVLMAAKYLEVDRGFDNVSDFNPASHFFTKKHKIDASPVFSIIQKMPKGAVLHAHDTSLIGVDYLINNITYREHLYVHILETSIELRFAAYPPETDGTKWQLLDSVRKASPDAQEFDRTLAKFFSLKVDDPKTEYKDINDVWAKFARIFEVIGPMLSYKPVYEDYFYESLRQFREDKVMYLEFRSVLPELYDLNGKVYSAIECAKGYKRVNEQFMKDYPDSFGSRLIYAPLRAVGPEEVARYVETAVELKSELGNYFIGFDLVGQEDLGRPLMAFLPQLLSLPPDIDVFYHSGETNWFGTSSDCNLIDAVLLGAKRLGHAYALLKHPVIARMVKEKEIAVEVNPISNQVLMLVEDLRNHPASIMLAENFPIVVSSDDPGLWGALPMSHDMYEAFVGLASRHADLRFLKQLALNSIKYSSMGAEEQKRAVASFEAQWALFINGIIKRPKVTLN